MKTRFRHFLACLLILSIPVQGFAASRMLFCATAHQAQAASPTPHQHVDNKHHTGTAESHHGATAHATKHGTSSQPDIAPISEQCPACDLCCNVCAVPPSNKIFTEQPTIEVFLQTYQLAVVSPTLEGLKRPPRATLA
jgi:hypothetical protein